MTSEQIRVVFSLVLVVLAAVLVWLAVRATRREPRRLSNGILLGLAALVSAEALSAVGFPGADAVLVLLAFLAVLSPLLVLVLAVLLIANGLQMIRRESRGLGNVLSLLLGVGLLALAGLPIVVLVARGGVRGLAISAALLAVAGYFGFLLLNFLVYAQIYRRLVRNRPAAWVLVLGSGLGAGGRVPPLLASRIRTGLAQATRHRAEVVVMSGGKGDDEVRSEAAAMTEWAIDNGADPARILTEDRSRNTEQNLRFGTELLTRALSTSRVTSAGTTAVTSSVTTPVTPPASTSAKVPAPSPAPGAGSPERTSGLAPGLIVTSNYHAMRAAILARRLGVPAQAFGSPTAGYYWPSAVLREFVAVLAEHPWRHLVLSLVIAVPLPALAFVSG